MILNIETSSKYCSVALSEKNELIEQKFSNTFNNHSAELGVLIDIILKNNNLTVEKLNAVSVSQGPGSYTGLRIGVSTAKGLAYASQIPIIAVNTLQILTAELFEKHPELNQQNFFFCPMIDARRMEVFTAMLRNDFSFITEPFNLIIDEFSFATPLERTKIVFYGDGAEKCKSTINHSNAIFVDDIFPTAKSMINLSYQKFLNNEFSDVAYFEPEYIKPFIATTSKNKLF